MCSFIYFVVFAANFFNNKLANMVGGAVNLVSIICVTRGLRCGWVTVKHFNITAT